MLTTGITVYFMDFLMLGFIGMQRFDDNAVRGAILVTDEDTNPLEFRVTAPVRPTSLQEVLYGELLSEHIAVKLLGQSLLSAVENQPDLIIVRNNLFLRLNNEQEVPTVLLSRENEPTYQEKGLTKQLNAPNSERSPLKVSTSSALEQEIDDISQRLQSIFISRDLMEPFERIERACSDVHVRKLGDA